MSWNLNPFQITTAVFACLAITSASPVKTRRDSADNGVSVELSQAGATEVRAVVTNTGSDTVRLFTGGTVLDSAPVRKLDIFQNGELVDFHGIVASHNLQNLPDDEFINLGPAASTETIINIASLYGVTDGEYSIQSIDAIPYAKVDTNKVVGAFRYASNVLKMNVSAADVAAVAPALPKLDERSVATSCNATLGNALRYALAYASKLSNNAMTGAASGDATKFNTYFGTTDPTVRASVAARFRAIWVETSSVTRGKTTYFCTDPNGICAQSGSIIAYTQPSTNTITNCPLFYELNQLSSNCDDVSQSSTVVHEMTHAAGLYNPNTIDYAYGYDASTSLTSAQALNNADNYALFADSVSLGC